MRVLVVGTRQVDAGKTTFTRGLRAASGSRACKPRAANDRWYDHDAYRHAIENGRLYGKDAWLLATDQGAGVSPESINPIHRLWRPIPDPNGGIHGRPYRRFVIDRVGEEYVVNANAELPPELRESLPLDQARHVDSLESMNAVVRRHHLPVLERWEGGVRDLDEVIVESYGDIAKPVQSMTFDVVAAVEPRRARYYDGARYHDACTVASGTPREGTLEPIVEDVVRELDPLTAAELPALTKKQRTDSTEIARAYRKAYETLFQLR